MKPLTVTSIPIPENTCPAERWWLTVRGQTFRQLPIEAALSLPVPLFQGDELTLVAFYFGVKKGTGPGMGLALPPLARVCASYPEGRLLTFLHRQAAELFPGLPSSGELGALTDNRVSPNERLQARRALFMAYERVIALYAEKKGALSEKKEFQKLFTRVAEPALIPYYHALNPDFYTWLEKE